MAKAQWECKQLDKDLFNKVKKIIDTGADLAVGDSSIEKKKIFKKENWLSTNFFPIYQLKNQKQNRERKK